MRRHGKPVLARAWVGRTWTKKAKAVARWKGLEKATVFSPLKQSQSDTTLTNSEGNA